MLSMTLYSCDQEEEDVEVVNQEVKSDGENGDDKAWENPRPTVDKLNMKNETNVPGTTRGY